MPRRRRRPRQGDGAPPYTGRVRRFLEPCVLLLLKQGESHGYDLTEELKEFGFDRVPADSSVVYRTLRRLEASGLVVSKWDTESASGPPRRVYRLTDDGERFLAVWVADLEETERVLRHFIDTYDRVTSTDGDSRSQPLAARSHTDSNDHRQEGKVMKVVVSASGMDLDSDASLTFGRCPSYVFVDTETMAYEGAANPAANAYGGAGIQAAQFVIEKGARAVLTGNVGPNAFEVLREADVAIFRHGGGSVRECVEAYKAGRLKSSADASVKAHAGMGEARAGEEAASGAVSASSRQAELAALSAEATDLRQRLAKVMERLDRLEKEG